MSLAPFVVDLFSLEGRVAVITGGAGLLGVHHAQAIAGAGGIPVLLDLDEEKAHTAAKKLAADFQVDAWGAGVDITDQSALREFLARLLKQHGRIDILINNAANNPKVEAQSGFSRVETFPLDQWDADVEVGLKGAFLCAQIFGGEMARRGAGVIINISSEYGISAPDQRLYRIEGLPEENQPVKPASYTVVKSGIIGMTKYLATYWGNRGVRTNCITIAGVFNGQPDEFVRRYVRAVPLGRMALPNEYEGSILYLCADASRFLNGANLVVDGGKSCW
jgi:NAD(P)-dependent dehydrogenase (short-subunit alcohol dehydrogenase family)